MRIALCVTCLLVALVCLACGGADNRTSNTPAANSNASNPQSASSETGAPLARPAHERAAPPSSSSSSSSSTGAGGEAIDTSTYDAEVARLQKRGAAKGASEADRTALAHAYLERAKALTKARQYRAALGDYRRTLKYDPANEEAEQMSGMIISILQKMGREVPAEGAEPTPLPYKQ